MTSFAADHSELIAARSMFAGEFPPSSSD